MLILHHLNANSILIQVFTSIIMMSAFQILHAILFFQSCFFLMVDSYNFSFPSFDPGSCHDPNGNLLCWGSVNVSSDGILNLTPENNTENKIARALFRYPVLAWPASFSASFTIRVVTNSTFSGDGMAFIFAQDDKPSPPESFGSFMGIIDPKTEGGVLRQLAVEFDTYKNEYEIDNNHVAIDTISVESPVVEKSLNASGIVLRSGREIHFKIDFDGWSKMMEIYVAYAGEPLEKFLSHRINLQEIIPHFAYVGFTASTAHSSEIHQVLSWNFSANELPSASLDQGLGRNNTRFMFLIIIPAAIFVPVIFISLAVFLAHRRRKKKVEMKQRMEMLSRDAANVPKMFTFCQLSKATHNFCKENLLGSGGFGTVFKGVVPDSPNFVAVKRINATSKQGTREYLAEICTIGRLRHKNLVQLQGWCHDHEKLLLVYEYMSNGSLDRYIGKCCLDWKTRFKILSGLASALLYLHEECGNPIVHRDIKPNNIMLDSEFNPHLGDFGLARIIQEDGLITTMVAGTPGYLAPEVSYTGRATLESDAYSYGMVILELVCGRRSKFILEGNSLVDHVWGLYENGELLSCVDPLLKTDYEKEQVIRTLSVGLACLHPDRMFRPRMRKVVHIFMNPEEPLMKLPECRPTAVYISWNPSSSESVTSTVYTGAPVAAASSLESMRDVINIHCHASTHFTK